MKQTTTLTRNQFVEKYREYTEDGEPRAAVLILHYDDQCGNGHNTFSATIGVYEVHNGTRGEWCEGGANNDLIARVFPEYAKYLRWHLVSSNGPLHYIANTTYHAGDNERDLDAARHAAVWPDATDEDLISPGLKERLEARLPKIMEDFKHDMEALGFIY